MGIRDFQAAHCRGASYTEQQQGRCCSGCDAWNPAPKRHIGLCERIWASTKPGQLCDHFERVKKGRNR